MQLKAAKVNTSLWYTWCGVVKLQYINLLGEIADEATFGCPDRTDRTDTGRPMLNHGASGTPIKNGFKP